MKGFKNTFEIPQILILAYWSKHKSCGTINSDICFRMSWMKSPKWLCQNGVAMTGDRYAAIKNNEVTELLMVER